MFGLHESLECDSGSQYACTSHEEHAFDLGEVGVHPERPLVELVPLNGDARLLPVVVRHEALVQRAQFHHPGDHIRGATERRQGATSVRERICSIGKDSVITARTLGCVESLPDHGSKHAGRARLKMRHRFQTLNKSSIHVIIGLLKERRVVELCHERLLQAETRILGERGGGGGKLV